MRLGIVYLIVCDVRDGQYTTAAPFARYVEALLPFVDNIRLMLPVSRSKPLERAGYPLSQHPGIEVVELPPIYHLKDFFRDYNKHRAILRKGIAGCDLVNLRAPNFLSLVAGEECLRADKPFFMNLVGDYEDVIRDENYHGIKRVLGNILAINHEARLKRLLGNAYVMVLGNGLYEKYHKYAKKMEQLTSTTINEEDFFERKDTCQKTPARVLTVAVMQGYKGIPHLLDAAAILKGKGREVEFDLLGIGGKLREYKKASKTKGVDDIVHFHGHIQYGPELFAFYRNADMFVLPSVGAEGTPRVVIEAMSQSLPVVVTRVGGNAGTVQEGECGFLLEPGDAAAIADSIESIIDDGELRRGLIEKGFRRAHDFTTENHSMELFKRLAREFPGMFKQNSSVDEIQSGRV